jgi:hypothetical protein
MPPRHLGGEAFLKGGAAREKPRRGALMDISSYRGYLIYLLADASLWNFTARPATPELPILPKVIYRPCPSREWALAEAKKRIDYLLAI